MAKNRAGRTDHAGEFYNRFAQSQSRDRVNLIKEFHWRYLSEIAINRYKWRNLPLGIDERFLELTLFRQGLCLFYFDNDASRFLTLQGVPQGHINFYNNPTQFRTVAYGQFPAKTLHAGVQHRVSLDENGDKVFYDVKPEVVPIWANYLHTSDVDIVAMYAHRLAEVERTIEINTEQLRAPVMFGGDENVILSLKNAYRSIREGEPAMFTTTSFVDDIKDNMAAFDTGVKSQTVMDLSVLRTRIWGEAMTALGINNSNQDKRERLVASEVAANDDQVLNIRLIGLHSRRAAAERINELWDTAIEVDWNSDVIAAEGFGDGDI